MHTRSNGRGRRGPLEQPVPFIVRAPRIARDLPETRTWHPWIEHVTVISGMLHMGTGDKLDRSKTTPLG